MINSVEKIFYSVDYNYELKEWLEQTKFYYSTHQTPFMGEALIIGVSFTCYTLKDKIKNIDYAFFKGNVFEKAEPTIYNVKVNLNYDGKQVNSQETINGEFLFKNLNKDLLYDLEFIDTSNKYNPKLLKSLTPEFDIEQPAKLIKFYDAVVIDNFEYYFGVYSLGEPQITLQNAPPTFVVEKISDDIYKIKGKNNNAVINFTIRLDDYREGGKLVSDELIVKSI